MVSTTQVDCAGADAKATMDKIEKGTHQSNMWQHNDLPSVFSSWYNNNILRSLSNFPLKINISKTTQPSG